MKFTYALLAAVLVGGAAPVIAAAVPAAAQSAPYEDARFVRRHDLQGVITEARPFFITVRVRDRLIPIDLHQGTVITPRGTTLLRGMFVNVCGNFENGTFFANRIALR